MRDNYNRFVLVEIGEEQAILSKVELGGVTELRTCHGQGMVLLRRAARALSRLLERDLDCRWILSTGAAAKPGPAQPAARRVARPAHRRHW